MTAKDDVDTILSVLKSKIHLDLVKKGNEYQELLFTGLSVLEFAYSHQSDPHIYKLLNISFIIVFFSIFEQLEKSK